MGGTAITPGGYDKATLARDLHALMGTLGIARAHVCGYDLGGGTAYAFASLFPEAVDKLVPLEFAPPGFGYECGI